MGYCLFNAVAVAARVAQRDHGLARVAVVDWDVHHGNGTQAIFESDPSALFVSLHQRNFYPPASGRLEEQGSGGGEGFTVNLPLPAGSGDEGYAHAFERVVEPVLRAFEPDLLIVSAGQDPSAGDPLGRMSVTAEGFRDMARRAVALAGECCGGRLLVFQEGGYSIDHVPFCNLAIVEALAGLEPAITGEAMGADVPAGLQPAEREAVAAAVEAHRRFWPLGEPPILPP
jgi:acetoin utilization deacetylase AcuC-like enzyme